MTQVEQQRLVGFNASLKTRGVAVSVNAANSPADLICLVETVDSRTRERLQTLDANVTHVLHALRTDITAKLAALSIADPGGVKSIHRPDTGNTYRVTYFQDDPQRPAILFHCVTVQ